MRIPKNFPCLMVQEGKHGNMYFNITCPEDIPKACKVIFDSFVGYYYDDKPDASADEQIKSLQTKIEGMKKDFQVVSNESLKIQIRKDVSRMERELLALEESQEESKIIGRIKNGDPKNEVVRFIQSRSEYEYEQITIEQYDKF